MPSPSITPLLFPTYLEMIKRSIGSTMFRTSFALVNGKKKNLLESGRISCAFFVSSLLLMFKLIADQHATVSGTVTDLKKFGWKKISKPKPGCIIVWDKDDFGSGLHDHIGFYLGNHIAVSNSSKKKQPVKHHWTYKGTRKVKLLLWHPKLSR